MTQPPADTPSATREYAALARQYGRSQGRCSELLVAQARAIGRLEAEAVRLRAAVVVRDTALAFAREDRLGAEAAVPGLPRRRALARRIEALVERARRLMRERFGWQLRAGRMPDAAAPVPVPVPVPVPTIAPVAADLHRKAVLCVGPDADDATAAQRLVERAGGQFLHHGGSDQDDAEALEASLVAADLVICQTGCVGHGAYWRVQDHCRRTGKQCVLVDRPQAIERMRAGGPPEAADALHR
ncbi:DUF2325 domain-containing protein [Xylophilus ampelinus]|uniref:Uncharacterized protein DUF2325 n=1 Tax=Xylophilus ampelinus TaxID=54067 RepID=A0A318SR01_9BURK|nr:DUF2325 domain-containing protein [Xylophilus ampelinus]MCS4508954.1 DUF2325 domain-containing protein [Xylophilus ampelinus]PYE79520.1 uncharacterized protein DUF2325 [Xylophilus ampelinus]